MGDIGFNRVLDVVYVRTRVESGLPIEFHSTSLLRDYRGISTLCPRMGNCYWVSYSAYTAPLALCFSLLRVLFAMLALPSLDFDRADHPTHHETRSERGNEYGVLEHVSSVE